MYIYRWIIVPNYKPGIYSIDLYLLTWPDTLDIQLNKNIGYNLYIKDVFIWYGLYVEDIQYENINFI